MAANIKIVKTLVLSGGMSFQVVSGVPAPGLQTEDVDVSDLSNATRMLFCPRPQLEETEMTFLLKYVGALAPVGASGTLTVTVTEPDATSLAAVLTGYVKSAKVVSVDINGERRLMQEVVWRPDGLNTAITTTSG